MEERLDKLLVQRNLVETRTRAEEIIQTIGVRVNGKLVTKTGKKFPADSAIELISEDLPWISVESLKLVEAVSKWNLSIQDGVFLDVGCQNGVFTDVLLNKGAQKIYAIDSKKDSLHPNFKGNTLVIDYTGKQLRELTGNNLTDELDGCVIDEPLLSMSKVLPFIHPFLKADAFVIAVIKPHLEVTKDHLKNNGFVRNTLAYTDLFDTLTVVGETNNMTYVDYIDSPIIGKDGQQEFIVLFKKN